MAGVRVEESPQGRRVEPEDRVQSGPASKPKLTRKLPNDRLFAGRFLRAAAPVTGSSSRSRGQLATGSRMSAAALIPVRLYQARLVGAGALWTRAAHSQRERHCIGVCPLTSRRRQAKTAPRLVSKRKMPFGLVSVSACVPVRPQVTSPRELEDWYRLAPLAASGRCRGSQTQRSEWSPGPSKSDSASSSQTHAAMCHVNLAAPPSTSN